MLAIVDYGMANLRSVQKAFERLGAQAGGATIVSTPEQVRSADRLVVPGVGAFRDAARVLRDSGLGEAIVEHARRGRPMLGICLGLQLLGDIGYEDGVHAGLGLVPGECVRFTVDQPPSHLKVPHMGWNALQWDEQASPALFRDLRPGAYVYFVHSYHFVPKDRAVIAATATYGQPFVAAIAHENIMAVQFHPEKSQEVGATILRNFAML